MKLCVDCKYSFRYDNPPSIVYCKHPNNGIDPVEGKVKSTLAVTGRAKQLFHSYPSCGPDGNWYEEKDPPPPAPKGWFSFLRK